MKRSVIVLLVLLVAACSSSNKASHEFMNADTAVLARAHATLVRSVESGNDSAASVMGVSNFRNEWILFISRYPFFFPSPVEQREIGDSLGHLTTFVEARRAKDALRILADVDERFRRARSINSADFFPDKLRDYHEAMAPVADIAARRRSASEVTDADMAGFAAALPAMKETWEAVADTKVNAAIYTMSKPAAISLRDNIVRETGALAALSNAVEIGDRSEALSSAVELKPVLVAIFELFYEFTTYRVK